jgi:hypothetical protein
MYQDGIREFKNDCSGSNELRKGMNVEPRRSCRELEC